MIHIGQAQDMFYYLINFLHVLLDLAFEVEGFGSKIEKDTEKFENFRKNNKSSPKN